MLVYQTVICYYYGYCPMKQPGGLSYSGVDINGEIEPVQWFTILFGVQLYREYGDVPGLQLSNILHMDIEHYRAILSINGGCIKSIHALC